MVLLGSTPILPQVAPVCLAAHPSDVQRCSSPASAAVPALTDVDRAASGGVSIDGGLYHRPDDAFGLACAFNAISTPAQRYFAAGGLGILAGDGALSYAGERVLETYYKAGFTKHFALTFDYQYITNPAYNTARGPVSVYGLRYHVQL